MKAKKKILALAVVAIIAAIAVIGTSLAWFTAKDQATNVFTIGKIHIVQNEQQRKLDENGDPIDNELEPFVQSKVLLPIVGSVANNGANDAVNPSNAKNYQDKIVTVTNDGNNPAYVRTFIAIPKTLDDNVNASNNMLHFNSNFTGWNWKDASGNWIVKEKTINGVVYNVYMATYTDALAKNATTTRVLKGVYLDEKTDVNAAGCLVKGNYTSTQEADKPITIYVATQAVQADGFTNAASALNAAFGDPTTDATKLPNFVTD